MKMKNFHTANDRLLMGGQRSLLTNVGVLEIFSTLLLKWKVSVKQFYRKGHPRSSKMPLHWPNKSPIFKPSLKVQSWAVDHIRFLLIFHHFLPLTALIFESLKRFMITKSFVKYIHNRTYRNPPLSSQAVKKTSSILRMKAGIISTKRFTSGITILKLLSHHKSHGNFKFIFVLEVGGLLMQIMRAHNRGS